MNRPDFEASLTALIATFAVLVGVSITDYLDPEKTPIPPAYFWWIFIMMIALMLRYIVGSAIHLKYMYGNRLPDLPRSRSACLFFKDGAFLVWFGALAVGMAHSWEKAANPADRFAHFPEGLDSFFRHAELFLTAGIAWSVTDCVIRYFYSMRAGRANEWPDNAPWSFWLIVDLMQLYLTFAVPQVVGSPLAAVRILAPIYVVLLYVDFEHSVRTLRG